MIPIWRHVPARILHAASGSFALRSGILIATTSRSCALVSLPTLILLGSPDPDAIFAAFLRSTAAGGCLVMKVNELSLNTVISTGRRSPAFACVCALKSLQNAIMFTPA